MSILSGDKNTKQCRFRFTAHFVKLLALTLGSNQQKILPTIGLRKVDAVRRIK